MPENYWGRPGYTSYVGTLTFSEVCLRMLFAGLFGELRKVSAKVNLVITGHYEPCQVDFIKSVSADYEAANFDVRVIAQPEYEGVLVDGRAPADHAGVWGTSLFWYFYPELTHMEFLFKIKTVQTDNGAKFTYKYISDTEKFPFDTALQKPG